jgi:hypothetical protein
MEFPWFRGRGESTAAPSCPRNRGKSTHTLGSPANAGRFTCTCEDRDVWLQTSASLAGELSTSSPGAQGPAVLEGPSEYPLGDQT